MNSDYMLNLLKKRKKEIVEELQNTPLYIELEQVKRSIAAITGSYSAKGDDLMIAYGDKKGYDREATSTARDSKNSPASELPRGKRTEFMYDLIEQIVHDAGGEIAIEEAERIIREEWNLTWEDKKKDNRLVLYITDYNKKNEDNQRLGLWPMKKEGKKRVKRYEKIVLIKNHTAQIHTFLPEKNGA